MIEDKVLNLDEEEIEILEEYEKGNYKTIEDLKEQKSKLRALAIDYLNKKANISVRISKQDLLKLKRKSVESGIPYQTIISSILHKFAQGDIRIEI